MATKIEQRAKDMLPSVLLTLASIIQALALEVLWNRAMTAEHLWHEGPDLWIGWLQVAAMMQLIVLVWVFYAHQVLRLSWVPSLRDSVFPFALGVGEFTLCAMLSPEQLHRWFYVLAALFVFAQFAVYSTFARAEKEPENAWFFEDFPTGVWIRHGPGAITVALFVGLGLLVGAFGPTGAAALSAVLVANVVMALQLLLQRIYWNRSLAIDPDAAPPSDAEQEGADESA
jgi:hypothetical protein